MSKRVLRGLGLRAARAALLGVASVALGAGGAQGVSIELTSLTLVLNAANTANQVAAGAGNLTSINQADGGGGNPLGVTGVLDPGGLDSDAQIGAMLDASTRYAASVWADSSATRGMTSSYRLSFTVNADPGVGYDILISHDLEGVLQTASPGALNLFCEGCAASVSVVTASVIADGGGTVGGSLVQGTAQSIGGDAAADISVAAALLSIMGLSGSQTLMIDFSWTSSATAGASDDAAARFGLQPNGGSLYGSPAASGPSDGHFVTIETTVTAIPEPSSVALLALGLVGLARVRARR